MKIVPNLFTRGMIVIAPPILCQAILVVVMVLQLDTIQSNLEQEAKSFNLILAAHQLFQTSSEEVLSASAALDLGTAAPLEEKQSQMNFARSKFEQLTDRLTREPNQKQNAQKLRIFADQVDRRIQESRPRDSSGNLVAFEAPRHVGMDKEMAGFLDTLARIVEVEQAQNENDSEATVKSVYQLLFVMAASVIATIISAVVLGKYYLVSISNPLNVLTANGKLLSTRSPLPPPMEDAAEFSRIDNLLHSVSTEMKEALAREKDVIENAVDVICSIDRDETFTAVNPTIEQMLGYTPTEVIGRHLSEVASGAEIVDAIESIRSTINTGRVNRFELKMRNKSGTAVDTRWSCLWSRAHKMFFCIVNDVTEQKRAERLKADFSETVSQDLRRPLVDVQNSLSLLIAGQRGPISPVIENMLTKTVKNLDRLILLANELLDFQKIKGGKIELETAPCRLEEIVQEAVDCVSILAEPKRITLRLPTSSCSLNCDRMKVLQTVVNLLSNAIKFSPMDSTIELEIREVEQMVSISVIDSGPGIPEDYRQRIFEPFEQVPSAQAKVGTGLGLAICKLIAEAHGGSVSLTSVHLNDLTTGLDEPPTKTGTTFTITLPKT